MDSVIRKSVKAVLLWLALGGTAMVAAEERLDLDVLSGQELADASGRQGISMQWQLNDNEQAGVVSDNVLTGNVVTGNNSISDQAFQNMSGIATVIQNTGNQVVIQDSTQINILINH